MRIFSLLVREHHGLWRLRTPKLVLHWSNFKVDFETVPCEGLSANPVCLCRGSVQLLVPGKMLWLAHSGGVPRRQLCCLSAEQLAGLWSWGLGTA